MRELGLVLVAIGSSLAYNIFLSFSDTTSMVFICKYPNCLDSEEDSAGLQVNLFMRC